MREREKHLNASTIEKRLLDANEVCTYLSLGKNRGIEFAKKIGSEIKVGRRSLFDKSKIDQYLNEQIL
jgi:predicted DNA-binding transcriptional regulator AlpA